MITAVIIDDQQDCIDDLEYLIKKNKLPVQILATANSGKEGLTAVLKHKPELLFLDVVMPDMSGFEMLDLLNKFVFQLIVTTSFDKYAVQALRSSALDFLLKPIKPKELADAIQRSIDKKEVPSKMQLNFLLESLKEKGKSISKIALPLFDGVELVALEDILFFESDGNYTTVNLKGEKQIVVSKPIGYFEEITNPELFYRVHNSFLVNLYNIKKFIRGDGGYIILENGKSINVARNRKEAFLERLTRI